MTAPTRPLVLLADDQEDNRIVYRMVLEHSGYAVREARDGAEAVEIARRYRPELVLMDLTMPVMDGWAATRELRADPATCDVPVVAISARDLLEPAELRAAGFCGFIQKPCLPLKVVRAVRRCLDTVERGEAWVDLRDSDAPYPRI